MKVAVTGIGLVTPLASTREATWNAILNARTGIRSTPAGLEARVYDFSPNGARSRMGDFALLAAHEALAHAGISVEDLRSRNAGCAVSQSKPILSKLDPALLLASFTGWSSEAIVQRELGLVGPAANVAAACATGVTSIEIARHWILSGQCDVALAGAAESSLGDFWRAGFQQMGVLAEGNSPTEVRPFDRDRAGFAMGEGAAVLVLESDEAARGRGAAPLAFVRNAALIHGGGDTLRFDPDGSAVARLIRLAAGNDHRPGYVNAHGTGTRFNDETEGRGLRLAFGADADRIPVSSTKAATGHLLGAAGAVEAALSVLALRDQILPPTLHLENPDVDLFHVRGQARRAAIGSALSLSYGFGGQMGAVWFDAA